VTPKVEELSMADLQFGPAQELRRAFTLDDTKLGPIYWYRPGKSAAVVMSVDDVFPGTSQSAYEAGGDLERGVLGRLLWLLERHPELQLTLFVTPDWRRISPVADRFWRHVPWLRDRVYLASVLPKGTMDVRNHPDFRRLSQFDAARRNRDTWPAPHSPRSFRLCRISAPGTGSVRCHAN